MPKNICPVCGYDKLISPPKDWSICPSCGTQFEYDDDMYSVEELRQRWIANNMQWWSQNTLPPPNWSPIAQFRNVGYEFPEEQIVFAEHISATEVSIELSDLPMLVFEKVISDDEGKKKPEILFKSQYNIYARNLTTSSYSLTLMTTG